MPRLSIHIIRTSLIYFALGSLIGAGILFEKSFSYFPAIWLFLPMHIEMLLFGWIIQLVIGVSFWMLPKFGSAPIRGNEKLVWVSFLLLNSGILLICISSLIVNNDALAFSGRLLELIAILFYARHAWPRVKPFADE